MGEWRREARSMSVCLPPPLSSQRAVVAASSTKSSFSTLWLAGYAHTALVGSRLAPHFYHHPALPPGP